MRSDHQEKAFPSGKPVDGKAYSKGMTLRDYFSGQAVVGSLSAEQPGFEYSSPEHVAEYAYKIADAMLKKRRET